MNLLVGAQEFWARARTDIAAANRRVLIQAMSFEGDATGLAVADALLASRAPDRRILVDDYTRVNINDRAVRSAAGRKDEVLQAEVTATDAMFRKLAASGVPVRVTNPIGLLALNYPARNHKKLIVTDDVAYIGGVNFSDHNFAWPDLMLRIDSAAAANFLGDDFQATFVGRAIRTALDLDEVRLVVLDGLSNAQAFAEVFKLIETARREVVVVSPYLTAPFTAVLGKATLRGVSVKVLTPWANNKPIVRDALFWAARRYGFEISAGPVMSHLKGLLIDGQCLVLGSSNFDFASLAAEEEFLAFVTASAVIADFQASVVAPAIADALSDPVSQPSARGWAASVALRLAAVAAGAARKSLRSAVDWPAA